MVFILDALDKILDAELDSLIEKLDSVISKTQEGSSAKLFIATHPEKGIIAKYSHCHHTGEWQKRRYRKTYYHKN